MICQEYRLIRVLCLAGEVTGGTVTGPALNATIIGGTAYPFVKTDGSATFANNVISGRTNDGVPFLVQDNGVGPGRNQQFTWLVSSVPPTCRQQANT